MPDDLIDKIAEMIEGWGGSHYSDDHWVGEPYVDLDAKQMALLIIATIRAAEQRERHQPAPA